MQTSVARMPEAVAGLLADNTRTKDCRTLTNAEASNAIAFGLMVALTATEGEAKRVAAITDALGGVSAFGQSFSRPDRLDDDGLQPGAEFDVLQHGRVYVEPADDVAIGDKVYVRMVAGADPTTAPAGQFGPDPFENALVYADKVFTADNTTEIFTAAAHGLQTGDGPFNVSNAGGALPTGLTALTDYWVIRIDANTFYLATSRANAIAGTHLSISTDGTGTQTISDLAGTKRATGLDISKFAKWRKSADVSAGEFAVLEIDMTKAALASVG